MISRSPLRLVGSAAFLLAAFTVSVGAQSQAPRVLVFSRTAGYPDSSIEPGIAAIRRLGQANGFVADATEDAGVAAIVFAALAPEPQLNALGGKVEATFEHAAAAGR